MTNQEILEIETALIGFDWNGENLYTYAEWKSRGYQVKRGSKAILTTSLWRPFSKEDEETGKTVTNLRMVKSSLFSDEQVEKIQEEDKSGHTR